MRKRITLVLIAILVFALVGCSEEVEETEEAKTEQLTENEIAETSDDSEEVEESDENNNEEEGLTSEEVMALEEDLERYLKEESDDLSIHSFEYEDGKIDAWVNLTSDPLPNQTEAKDILAGVTWRLAELTEVDTSGYYDVNTLLITEDEGDIIHWLTERYRNGEYDMIEEDAFDILPK